MSRCTVCNSTYADPDIRLCFECFCDATEYFTPSAPTETEYCAAYGHEEYEHSGRCYCGQKYYLELKDA